MVASLLALWPIIKGLSLVIGPLAIAVGIYLYGVRKGHSDKDLERFKADAEMDKEAEERLKKIFKLEDKRYETIEKQRTAPVDELIRLFNKEWGRSSTDSHDPDKKAP